MRTPGPPEAADTNVVRPERPTGVTLLASWHALGAVLCLLLGLYYLVSAPPRLSEALAAIGGTTGFAAFTLALAALGGVWTLGLFKGHPVAWWVTAVDYPWRLMGAVSGLLFILSDGMAPESDRVGFYTVKSVLGVGFNAWVTWYLFRHHSRGFFLLPKRRRMLHLGNAMGVALGIVSVTSIVSNILLRTA